MLNRANDKILQIVITILALGDGALHFALDLILFRGNFFGSGFPAGPPPGAAPGRTGPPPGPRSNPLILPLNELFLLNFIGAVVLVLLFWFSRRWLGERRWLMDIVMIAYAAATFGAWLISGRPNPMGLGYLSKSIEIVLVIVLFVHTWGILRTRSRQASAPAA
jgi:hypothetical protein